MGTSASLPDSAPRPRGAAARRQVVRAVLDHARASGDVVAPWRAVPGTVPADTAEGPGAVTAILVDLHREWLRVLVGRLHRGGIAARLTPAEVRARYDDVAATQPTLRALLTAHAAHPALEEPTAAEHAMLARLAGLATAATPPDRAASLGRSLLAPPAVPAVPSVPAQHSGVVARA